MELLLVVVFVLVLVSFQVLRSKLEIKYQLTISVLSGSILLFWFWTAADIIYLKIMVSVVVVSSIIKLSRKYIKPGNNKAI